MGYRRVALAIGEWFHCYTRTIDHSRPFAEEENVQRFLETLYLANQSAPMPVMPELHRKYSHNEILALDRKPPLVAIGAYCIMPTHYHLLAQPVVENGLSEFMHKVGTGFTRFYNDQHERAGNLFIKPFRSKHISSEGYFGRVASYIHLNPVELFEPEWKRGRIGTLSKVKSRLLAYPHSSLPEYEGVRRPQGNILDRDTIATVSAVAPPLVETIRDAAEYYQFLELEM